jgi:DNA-binding MarR family transcriptional regulator
MQHSESLLGHFARAQGALLMSLQARLKSHGFSIVDWRVLKALRAEDGMRITDLAERALSRQVTITHMVGRMEQAGLLRRFHRATGGKRHVGDRSVHTD